jgi:hypothetical protein
MEYSANFAFGRYNLANLYVALKQPRQGGGKFPGGP